MQVLREIWLLGLGLQNKPHREFCCPRVKTKAVRKRKGPATLASVALGPALSNKEDTNEDASPPSPNLMILVDLCKGLGSEDYYPYSALVDSGITYNFICQSVTNKLRLEAVKGRKVQGQEDSSPYYHHSQ
jgi:hypothetical protein